MDKLEEGQIKSLLLKGFTKEEIVKLLEIKLPDIEKISSQFKEKDLLQTSRDLYSEFQKDLSKLVFTEMNKPERDSNVILNAIKLQADLQVKKLSLIKSPIGGIKKDYLHSRDEEIWKLKEEGLTEKELAEKFQIGILSVKQAIDRHSLELPEHLKTIPPSIISETIGLDKKTRINILEDAYKNDSTRKEIRELVIQLKNKGR